MEFFYPEKLECDLLTLGFKWLIKSFLVLLSSTHHYSWLKAAHVTDIQSIEEQGNLFLAQILQTQEADKQSGRMGLPGLCSDEVKVY